MAYVYIHRRKDNNEPFYVGVGGLLSFDNYQRANANNWKGLASRSDFWKNYVNLYGFIVEIVLDNCTKIEAFEEEAKLIKKYGRKDLNTGILVNHTDGKEGRINSSKEINKKCGLKNIGKKASKQARLNMSKAQKARKPKTEQERIKTSNSHLGKIKSKSHLKKLKEKSIFKHNYIPWNKGLSYKREAFVLNLETGIYYNTIKEAANTIDLKNTMLVDMLRNKTINRTSFIKLKYE